MLIAYVYSDWFLVFFFFLHLMFSARIDGSSGDSDGTKENFKKWLRSESCGATSSKACREKLHRDRLNDKFLELGDILEPGKPPKTDKAAALIQATRFVAKHKLKDSNLSLQEKIKELKAEKNQLRDEKQRLKVEKDKLEQQLKSVNVHPHTDTSCSCCHCCT
ncbi:hypothetical protein SAY86_015851 [Trapa natans]|uniref:BHLH domain-containing protein n=1 Tax=Trapa natans TaxID=22666 RepID=A0AAN7LBY4_TRANT|nr:hypothetical protein SAY86_015851 [Trapa natans]